MKVLNMKILYTAVLALVLQFFMPWWSVVIAAFVIGRIFEQSGLQAFLTGFFGVFLMWFIYAGVISYMNDGVLATRLSNLLSLPAPFFALLVTGIVGGLAGGFGALTGNRVRVMIQSFSK